jgi:hypothetical protein
MRVQVFSVFVLSAFVSGRLFAESEYLQEVKEATTTIDASPASVPTSGSATVTSIAGLKGVE